MAFRAFRAPVPPSAPDPSLSIRAQLLATEHWSLLATRSMTQMEMLQRISTFLTLVSASVLSLAFVGQVTGFGGVFPSIAIVLLSIVLIIGTLTAVRVFNAGIEDLAYVLAMNRVRAAYVELDPGIEKFLMTSVHDDFEGSLATYIHLGGPNRTQVIGSSMFFVAAVNAALAGVLAALIFFVSAMPGVLAYIVGGIVAVTYLGVCMGAGGRRYFRVFRDHVAVSPTPDHG